MSKIEWTEKTWNPITGCTKHSEGCQNCYAEVMARRLKGMGQEKYRNGFEVTLHPGCLAEPTQWKKPSMVFVCSMSDLFHKDVPSEFIDKVMEVIRANPQHTFQVLTKRAERMYGYFQDRDVPENVWLGVTVEAIMHKERISYLSSIRTSSVRFLSCEPLLSELAGLNLTDIDWVIVGGESGQNARPMCKEWVENIQHQCQAQSVPFFFKQWGAYGEDGVKRNKKANGCLLNGKEYKEMPL